ncbi:MAG: NosD domain-containing protein [Candidatus Nealsonbacteria bacterium]
MIRLKAITKTIGIFLLFLLIGANVLFLGQNGESQRGNLKVEIIAAAIDTDPKVHVNNNWAETAVMYDWCTGSGTYEDPYVIKDLIIDANQAGDCILIENTGEYFVIENCTVYNASRMGIRLNYVINGKIVNNHCLNNSYGNGIFLYYSSNNTITGNDCMGNYGTGIRLCSSHHNTVTGNNCTGNKYGIDLGLNNNTITGNNCTGNRYGIRLSPFSYNNTIIGNNCTNNDYVGIYLGDYSQHNTITENNCKRNYWYGIFLRYSNNNTIIGNNCTDNDHNGIYLDDYSHNNTITGNTCTRNWDGIRLSSSHHNTITGNNCTGNGHGIVLSSPNSSNNNTIIGNNCTDNDYYGIYLDSSNNTITGNNCTNNEYGIYLDSPHHNTIIGNNCTDNDYAGICLDDYSSNNTIIGNNCTYNDNYGIYLCGDSDSNEVANNFLIKNGYGCIKDEGTNNIIYNNTCILVLNTLFQANVTEIIEGGSIQFTDKTASGRYPLTYQWNFGDGSLNSTVQNPIHKYNSAGTYLVVLMVTDADGDVSVYSIEISVQDVTNPILDSPDDVTYEEGTTTNSISWTATDNNPDTYIIYRDGLEIDSGTWTSGVAITINVDGLAVGSYNYTIVVTDAFDNAAFDTVWVTVESDIIPDDVPPDDTTPDDSTPDLGIIILLISLIGAAGVAAIIIFLKLKRRQH